jgi:Flp pilus assembly protein TadD
MARKIRVVLFIMAAFAAVFWLLVTPGNPLTAALQASMSDTNARVIVGPYPLESDFLLLRLKGVKTVISLLDPRLPYERVLIERERRLAARYGMKILNFPMTSILGRPFREDYQRMAAAAAQAVEEADGKVYLHCYLGLHRTKAVQNLLEADGAQVVRYDARAVQRPLDKQLLERAESQFNKNDYSGVLQTLSQIQTPDTAARLLEGWARYRMGKIAAANVIFDEVARNFPGQADAHVGLGYCALRQGRLQAADQAFSLALKLKPEDPSALVGMGLVRERQQQFADATTYLRRGLQLDPTNDEARKVLRQISVHRQPNVTNHPYPCFCRPDKKIAHRQFGFASADDLADSPCSFPEPEP